MIRAVIGLILGALLALSAVIVLERDRADIVQQKILWGDTPVTWMQRPASTGPVIIIAHGFAGSPAPAAGRVVGSYTEHRAGEGPTHVTRSWYNIAINILFGLALCLVPLTLCKVFGRWKRANARSEIIECNVV